MKIKLSIALLFCFTLSNALFSQNSEELAVKQEVKNGTKTTFKNGSSSVTDYLNSKSILEIEKIQYKRGVFKLLITDKGEISGVTLIYGGITESIENQLISAFFKMPNWNTTISEKQLAIVYIVVTVKDGKLSTEIY
ncbi:MAG: hypothetical protein ACK46Y_09590 [Fluviicola sp.]|jgi:hypothetical protein